MDRTKTFTCCSCGHCCLDDPTLAGSLQYQHLWDEIHSSPNILVEVTCPNQACSKKLVQCCLCEYNVSKHNDPSVMKSHSSAIFYAKRKHVDKVHSGHVFEPRSRYETLAGAHAPAVKGTHSPVHSLSMASGCTSLEPCDILAGIFEDDEHEPHSGKSNMGKIELTNMGNINADFGYESQNDSGTWSIPSVETSSSFDSNESFASQASGDEVYLDNDHAMFGEDMMNTCHALETERENMIYDEAMEFVNEFKYLDLDPTTVDENEDVICSLQDIYQCAGEGAYSYDDFSYFDVRQNDEKLVRKGSTRERYCQNQLYFFQKYQRKSIYPDDDTGGFAGLVHRANVRNREDASTVADHRESNQMFRLLKILLNSPGKMKEEVIEYQAGLFELFDIGHNDHKVKTRFPTDMQEARGTVLEGMHSILKNFPVQRVFEIGKHACVDLKETVYLMAGHGAKFNFAKNGNNGERNMDGLNGTRAVDDMIEDIEVAMAAANVDQNTIKKTNVGWMLFWSDAFLRCFIKQRENSVWILTVTICPPEHMKSSGLYTHVLAMGKSSDDHTKVIEYYVEQCKELMKGFECYFGESNKIERVAFSMLAWNADRPERQMISNTRKEGTYGKVSGWAVNPSEDLLPSCLRCYRRLVHEMLGDCLVSDATMLPCTQCCNWSFNSDSDLQLYDHVGKDYPKSENTPGAQPPGRKSGQKKLGPVKLNTEWLIEVVTHGYNELRNGNWSKAELREYLKTCNVKGSRVEIVVQMATDDKKTGAYNPLACVPKLWVLMSCFDRYKLPDVPLHGIGHGMIPDVMNIANQILSHYGKLTSFCKYANTILDDIGSFRLDYCKVKNLPKAAWVGENSMAFMRLMSYLYGMYLMNHELGPLDETKGTVSNLKCMLNAFQTLVSVLMSMKKVSKKSIDDHMKLFMSSAHYLHVKYGNLNRKNRQTEVPIETNQRKKRKRQEDYVLNLNIATLRIVVKELDQDVDVGMLGKPALQKKLKAITVVKLRSKLSEWRLSIEGMKEDLQKRVCTHLMSNSEDMDVRANTTNDGVDGPSIVQSKSETKCWNHGNWLSFMANISGQIEYIGQLPLIW